MIIFAQNGMSFVNADNIDVISVEENSQEGTFDLLADVYELGQFPTENEAVKWLRKIAVAMEENQKDIEIRS